MHFVSIDLTLLAVQQNRLEPVLVFGIMVTVRLIEVELTAWNTKVLVRVVNLNVRFSS